MWIIKNNTCINYIKNNNKRKKEKVMHVEQKNTKKIEEKYYT